MKHLAELAARYQALEENDKNVFQRKARILQSMWREQNGLPIGEQKGRRGSRPLGSRLKMPDAQSHLWNFLTDNIKSVVRSEVLDPSKSKGKLIQKPRVFNDMLSSQPLCFNLFAELKCDLDLATAVFKALTLGRARKVTGIEFEHSPGRGNPVFTDDGSAFDVFIQFSTPAGRPGFVGIEVKYHENLLDAPAPHRDRYDEIASMMCCFSEAQSQSLKMKPLQQIWRDHLLAGALKDCRRLRRRPVLDCLSSRECVLRSCCQSLWRVPHFHGFVPKRSLLKKLLQR